MKKFKIHKLKKNIRLLVLDVDGTLTDGKVYMGSSGELIKAFDIKDGYGLCHILPEHQIVPVIITGRTSEILFNRCRELKILHVYQGITDKMKKLEELLLEIGLCYDHVAYMGDDINDIPCMMKAALVGCPLDAVRQVKALADFIAKKDGGNGAVREFIEWLCK